MSDLSGLHGVFAPSLRWNAEEGFLSVSVFNSETGEREPKEIDLGPAATFVMDMATRERGYGAIRVGFYDMRLTPVSSPPPPWPGDEEYKPALGCWVYHPDYGELRLETNAAMFREAVTGIWDAAKSEPQAAAAEQQPVVRFTGRVSVPIKALKKSFYRPVIEIVGSVERNKVPGWAARTPTVKSRTRRPQMRVFGFVVLVASSSTAAGGGDALDADAEAGERIFQTVYHQCHAALPSPAESEPKTCRISR